VFLGALTDAGSPDASVRGIAFCRTLAAGLARPDSIARARRFYIEYPLAHLGPTLMRLVEAASRHSFRPRFYGNAHHFGACRHGGD